MRKDALRSIRSFSRARTSERGFALAMAVIVAVLYFGMIELMMLDSSRELAAARRFRARIVAQTLAENAAEGAALRIVTEEPKRFEAENDQGTMAGKASKSPPALDGTRRIVIQAEGESSGLESSRATVWLEGWIYSGGNIEIEYARHTQ
jgi:Tfp pilus assembly protein PilX